MSWYKVLVLAVLSGACSQKPAPDTRPPTPLAQVADLVSLAREAEAKVADASDRLGALRLAAHAWGLVLRADPSSTAAQEAVTRIASAPEASARRAWLERFIMSAIMARDDRAAAALLAELKEWEPLAADLALLPLEGLVIQTAIVGGAQQ